MEICKLFAVVVAMVVLYSAASSEGGDDPVMTCVDKVMPCYPYLHQVNPPPPPACCVPLKEILEKDATCLCSVFNNPEILKQFNLTKENALVLPKTCGAKVDVSACALPASPTASPVKGGASVPAVNFIGLGFVTAFVAIILF